VHSEQQSAMKKGKNVMCDNDVLLLPACGARRFIQSNESITCPTDGCKTSQTLLISSHRIHHRISYLLPHSFHHIIAF
jgi:hypothetical protein